MSGITEGRRTHAPALPPHPRTSPLSSVCVCLCRRSVFVWSTATLLSFNLIFHISVFLNCMSTGCFPSASNWESDGGCYGNLIRSCYIFLLLCKYGPTLQREQTFFCYNVLYLLLLCNLIFVNKHRFASCPLSVESLLNWNIRKAHAVFLGRARFSTMVRSDLSVKLLAGCDVFRIRGRVREGPFTCSKLLRFHTRHWGA